MNEWDEVVHIVADLVRASQQDSFLEAHSDTTHWHIRVWKDWGCVKVEVWQRER